MGIASDTLSFLKRGLTSGVEGVIEAVLPKETGVFTGERIVKQFREGKGKPSPAIEKFKQERQQKIETRKAVVEIQKQLLPKIASGQDLTPQEQELLSQANKIGFGEASGIALGFMGGLKISGGVTAAERAAATGLSKGLIVSNAADDVISGYIKKRISIGPIKQLKPGLKDKVYDSFQSIYTSTVDRFNPIVNATKQAKLAGAQILPGKDPELLARRYLGTKGIAETKLFWKTTDLTPQGNLKITGDGLSSLLKPVRNNLDDLRAMLVAERDIELATRIGKATIKGTTPAESGAVINALKAKYGENFNTLQKASDDVRNYSRKAILDPLRDSGIISNKTYANIVKSNQFYTPFQRLMNDLETKGFIGSNKDIFQPKGSPIKKIKGSDLQIIDPLESLVKDTYRVTDLVERTRVAKSITDLSPSIPDLIQPVTDPTKARGKNVISTFENGEKQFFKVSPELFKAMEGMTAGDSNIITKVLGLPAKALRAGAILNPEFALRNPIRDQMSAFIFSKYGFRPGIDPVVGLFNTIGKTETFNRWLAGGGAQSMFTSLDRIATQKTLQQVASKKLGALSPQGALAKFKGFVKEPLGPLRTLSEFSEEGTRIGAFRRAQKKGATNIEAVFESRDITLDFARIGSQTGSLNKIIAFFNANVQGTDKLIRAFKEKPIQTNLKAIIGITIPSIALYLSQRDDPRYKEVPQWQKDLFWVIVPPGENSPIIRIPKPFLLGTIYGTIPEKILQWLDENDPEALSTIPEVLLKGATPGFIPTAVLPLIENQANYSFFRDRPIVSQSLEGLPAEFQANTYTSETAKEIGKIIKKSPAKIENLVNGYFAGLGRYALDTSDFILEQVGLTSPPPAPKKALADLPILRAFIVREPIGNSSESVNRFFKEFERISEQNTLARTLANQGKLSESQAVLEEHPEIFLFKGMNGIVQDMSEIRKMKELVFQSQKLSPEDKQDRMSELDRMMTEMAKQALIVIEESGL